MQREEVWEEMTHLRLECLNKRQEELRRLRDIEDSLSDRRKSEESPLDQKWEKSIHLWTMKMGTSDDICLGWRSVCEDIHINNGFFLGESDFPEKWLKFMQSIQISYKFILFIFTYKYRFLLKN